MLFFHSIGFLQHFLSIASFLILQMFFFFQQNLLHFLTTIHSAFFKYNTHLSLKYVWKCVKVGFMLHIMASQLWPWATCAANYSQSEGCNQGVAWRWWQRGSGGVLRPVISVSGWRRGGAAGAKSPFLISPPPHAGSCVYLVCTRHNLEKRWGGSNSWFFNLFSRQIGAVCHMRWCNYREVFKCKSICFYDRELTWHHLNPPRLVRWADSKRDQESLTTSTLWHSARGKRRSKSWNQIQQSSLKSERFNKEVLQQDRTNNFRENNDACF